MLPTVGVIGNGFVGHAVVRGFMEYAEVRVFDVVPEKSTHKMPDVLECDFVFVCVPTPEAADGSCELRYIRQVLDDVEQYGIPQNENRVIAIKSTVPPGTTRELADFLDMNGIEPRIVHNPEFLTARCAVIDFQTPARNLVGAAVGHPASAQAAMALASLLERRFPGVPCITSDSSSTELVKLACNSFFALKVGFFNELYLLAEKLGANFEDVRRGVLTDGRITHSHTLVPGPDGRAGAGGDCLPKDIADLAATMRKHGLDSALLDASIARNRVHRAAIAR